MPAIVINNVMITYSPLSPFVTIANKTLFSQIIRLQTIDFSISTVDNILQDNRTLRVHIGWLTIIKLKTKIRPVKKIDGLGD